MRANDRIERQPVENRKHQLVAAIARGDERVAEEIRMLLRLKPPELLRGMRRN